MKRVWLWLVLLVLIVPAYSLMLRPGIFTMHDPHLFRVHQFDACFKSGIFPCRWALDSGMGYGEPLFNFYAQFPYWITQAFRESGMSILDSAKAAYILSLMASGLGMFVLGKRLWGTAGGFFGALVYTYAPYRAVDVWVRGALPESLAFVFYPLIIYALDVYLETRRITPLLLFSVLSALLITTHNLSFVMFAPFLFVFWLARSISRRDFKNLYGLIPATLLAGLLSAYYWLPVLVESKLVTISQTTVGYYDFHIHFTTLRELFVSRYWGYGASLWAQKFLSVSVGQVQWILPALLIPVAILNIKKSPKLSINFLLFAGLGFFALFLTHGKSSVIWNSLSFMKYVQFPWRFLTIGTFFLALSAGFAATYKYSRMVISLLIVITVLLNFSFFRPDIWRSISDHEQFTGELWDEGRSSSLSDFWPKSAPALPREFAPLGVEFTQGLGVTSKVVRNPGHLRYNLLVGSTGAWATFPVTYFPGWVGYDQGKPIILSAQGELGLISTQLKPGWHDVTLLFTNTPVRSVGNWISLLSFLTLPLWCLKKRIG